MAHWLVDIPNDFLKVDSDMGLTLVEEELVKVRYEVEAHRVVEVAVVVLVGVVR